MDWDNQKPVIEEYKYDEEPDPDLMYDAMSDSANEAI